MSAVKRGQRPKEATLQPTHLPYPSLFALNTLLLIPPPPHTHRAETLPPKLYDPLEQFESSIKDPENRVWHQESKKKKKGKKGGKKGGKKKKK
jgi:hypothetical protein